MLAGTLLPAHLIVLWREGRFDLLISAKRLNELMRMTRYPRIREHLAPALVGRLVNEIRNRGLLLTKLPVITASPDAHDKYLLAMAVSGAADFRVTGDKRDLLALRIVEGTRIITVRDLFCFAAEDTMNDQLPVVRQVLPAP